MSLTSPRLCFQFSPHEIQEAERKLKEAEERTFNSLLMRFQKDRVARPRQAGEELSILSS